MKKTEISLVKTSGFIYLMKSMSHSGVFKIGSTSDPIRRISEINDPLPVDMLFYHKIYVGPKYQNQDKKVLSTERELHKIFGNSRLDRKKHIRTGNDTKREWFRLTDSDLVTLDRYLVLTCRFYEAVDNTYYETTRGRFNLNELFLGIRKESIQLFQ